MWLRRDLRLFDHTALQTAIRLGRPLAAVFVFDRDILDDLPADDRRLSFIHESISEMQAALRAKNVPLWVLHRPSGRGGASVGHAAECGSGGAPKIPSRRRLRATIRCGARSMPMAVRLARNRPGDAGQGRGDDAAGQPYSVFTPYKKAWLHTMAQRYAGWQPADDWAALAALQAQLPAAARAAPRLPALADLGFVRQALPLAGGEAAAQKQLGDFLPQLGQYHLKRDFPAQKSTSQLSVYLRFGLLFHPPFGATGAPSG